RPAGSDSGAPADVVRRPAVTEMGRFAVSWYPFEEESWEDGDGDGIERGEAAGDGEERFAPRAWAPGEEGEMFGTASGRWPLDPRGLRPRERWQWYEQVWSDACMLRERYRLGLRAG